MAKTDVIISSGVSIDEVRVSQKAKNTMIRLRSELRGLQAQIGSLEKMAGQEADPSKRLGLQLAERDARNRAISIERRLGRTPEEMSGSFAARESLNQRISATRKERHTQEAQRILAQKQEEYYNWLVEAAGDITDPVVDKTRPITQKLRRRVHNQLGSMLMTPGIENVIGDERARKAAELYDKLTENTEASTSLVSTIRSGIAAGAGGIAFGSSLSSKAASILGNRIAPFDELRSEFHQMAKTVGGTVGAAIGSFAGPLGAAVGGALGSWLTGYMERSKSASDAAKQDTIQMLRMRNLYGRGSFNSAMMAANLGYIDYGDYEGVASAINVAPYAAAFGDISTKQWIGLSLLPNYMAALFGGSTPEQAMDALQQDLDARGSGLGQYAVSLLGGLGLNENVRAFVMSGNYKRWREAGYTLQEYEDRLAQAAPGYEDALFNVAEKNREERDLSVRRGTWTLSKYNYAGQPLGGTSAEITSTMIGGKALPEFDLEKLGFVKRELNIFIDNDKVNVGNVYTLEGDWLTGATSYTIGGNQ